MDQLLRTCWSQASAREQWEEPAQGRLRAISGLTRPQHFPCSGGKQIEKVGEGAQQSTCHLFIPHSINNSSLRMKLKQLSSARAMKPSLDGDDQTNTKELEKLGIENKEGKESSRRRSEWLISQAVTPQDTSCNLLQFKAAYALRYRRASITNHF